MAAVTPAPVTTAGSVTAVLDDAVRATPHAPAVRDATGAWTYAELDTAARSVTHSLIRAGVRPGDRVALHSRNRRELPAVLFGAARAGAALVPLSPHLPPAGLSSVLADAVPAALLAPADGRSALPTVDCPVISLEDAVSGPAQGSGPDAASPDGTALLIYTSGSTAAPKGVVCPHRAVDFAARAIAARLDYRADDVILVGSPMSFDYGLYQILLSALAGAELVLTDADDPIGMLRTLRASRATVVPIVPSTARMLVRLARRGEPPRHVRMFTNTGAALTAADIEALRTTFPCSAVVSMYGITECKRVTVAGPDADRERPGTVGTALPGTTVRILDEAGRPVGPGEPGRIVVSGPHVMSGYRGAPELTAERFDRDPESGEPRLHTGDYGHLDADGHLYFHGRRDDQFKRRGVRTSAIEIETAAAGVAGVRAAAALPPEGEYDLELAVVTDRSADAVLAGLRELLEPGKVPARCHLVEDLPLTPNGKTDKKRLRELVQPETGSAQ
ncbi:AMP-binding protein [Streptomyces sp. ACA25]|uniref:class I adenylate-forming enzyme family protein n=1 Tax=Streptomyces sp. ACA25 TaxID=3022596 RepID=UPI00230750F4|nr:AMP-binding protein [Streptomyces sp. ACA25]MDB1089337.1 AMP-binding protein [Streptomyces sp. ACA25]